MKTLLSSLITLIMILSGIECFSQTNTFPSTGNTGIGTLSPSHKLHVVGDVAVDGYRLKFPTAIEYSGSGQAQIWRDPVFGFVINTASGSAYDFALVDPSGNGLLMAPHGYQQLFTPGDFGINAAKKFYLDGISDTYISEVSGNAINFVSGGTEKM